MVSDSGNGSNRGGVIETVKDNLKPLGVIVLGIAASIYLGLTLKPEKPNLPRYEPFDSQNGSYQPSASQCSPAALLAIRDVRKRAAKSDDCADKAEDYRLKADDLIQQSRAADAAQVQAILAYDQAWVALWATLGGLWTLIAAGLAAAYARDAAREGWRSANAAECTLTETENANRLAKDANDNALQQAKAGSTNTRKALKIASQNAVAAFDAAKAMLRQNELTEHAQRPWVKISAELVNFELVERRAIIVDWSVKFENIGQMVAHNFQSLVKFIPMDEKFFTHMAAYMDDFPGDIEEIDAVLIPRDSSVYKGQSGNAIESLPWETKDGFRKDCVLMLIAMARYRIPGNDTWRFSMQGFAIAENLENIDDRHFRYDFPDSLSLKDMHIRKLGRSRAS